MKIETIVFFSIDSLRADCIPGSSSTRNPSLRDLFTPTIHSLMQTACHFTNTYSSAVFTPPAHASLFTGDYQPNHRIREFYYHGETLSKRITTLAEFFKSKGYSTHAYTDMLHVFQATNLLRGFDHISDKDSSFFHDMTKWKRSKRFIFIHLLDVHTPYLFSPSNAFVDNSDYFRRIYSEIEKSDGRTGRSAIGIDDPYRLWNSYVQLPSIRSSRSSLFPLYKAGINKFDRGRFKIFLKNLHLHIAVENTVTFLFSDHGEGQASVRNPSFFRHGPHLSDDVLHIPLIISSPSFHKYINDKLLSICDIHHLAKRLINNPTQESINGYQNPNNFVYAESFECRKNAFFTTPNNAYLHEVRYRKKTDYYIYERQIRTPTQKLTLWFKPELFFSPHRRQRSLRASIQTLHQISSAYSASFNPLQKLFLIIVALCYAQWKKVWMKIFYQNLEPPIEFEIFNKQTHSIDEQNKIFIYLFRSILKLNRIKHQANDIASMLRY
ncbi:sulfatase-like hydrolase/transferase [Candidatus Gottesmanbacteria bacterium]|nr:sulfatase-like hydrolase/transferase [Candidatus Gottesmanbacteria bacterium]